MILSDIEIQNLCENPGDQVAPLIYGFKSGNLNPSSYDLELGNQLMIEEDPSLQETDEEDPNVSGARMVQVPDFSQASEENPYFLSPGQFALASSVEVINLPNWIAAAFYLKSSRAREGLEHSHAGFCDPGWNGSNLTLELSNVSQFSPQRIWPGKKIGQLVFFRMNTAPLNDYSVTGRYNNDAGPAASRG